MSADRDLNARAHSDAQPCHPLEFLTAREVAAIFRVTTRTLWTWESKGLLQPVRVGGRRRYRVADIDGLRRGSRP